MKVADTLSDRQLYTDLKAQLKSHQLLVQMELSIPNRVNLHQCLQNIFLDDQLRNKVTIAKKSEPDLYTHSLRASISAAIIGFYLGMSQGDCNCLATAGLIHDLGHMHMDSSKLKSNHLLLPEEKKIVYAHPVIMYLLLRDSRAYHPNVSVPVLEHHERRWGCHWSNTLRSTHCGNY